MDFRSDTVTNPTREMRRAMYIANVGDDVYGEDPSVNKLEVLAAMKLGKPAGLFVASGTMSNLIAILAQTNRGNEIIVGSESHIFWYEVGGASAIAGTVLRTVPNQSNGEMRQEDVEKAIRPKNIHAPPTALICLENTQNRCGGTVLTPDYTAGIVRLARKHGLKVHLDGARLFNAAVALNTPVTNLTRGIDSVGICLSKGLSAPVGSVLCGSVDFVERARKWRKMLGGGMRQAGIIAAAGIVALETMVERLAEDHINARRFAEGLGNLPGITVAPAAVQTNIVLFEVDPSINPQRFLGRLKRKGILLSLLDENRFRVVTHREITPQHIEKTLDVLNGVLKRLR